MSALPNDDNVFPIVTSKLSADFTIVTPSLAADWLRLNNNNRNMRGANVAMYARDISLGKWIVTGQSVQFDRDGTMIDGQHRLMAIIRADKPVMLLVVRGLDPKAKSVIDAGAKRTAADALKFAGVTNYTAVAALCRLCILFESGGDDTRHGSLVSNSEVEDYRDAHPEVELAVAATRTIIGKIQMLPSVTAYCWMRLADVSESDCAAFFTAIVDSATDGKGDPRKTLLDKLRDDHDKGIRTPAVKQAQYVIRAWNYWRAGKSLTLLKKINDKSIPVPR